MHDVMVHLFAIPIPVIEKMVRTMVVYFFLIIGLRLAGKRELAQLNPFDLVVLLTLSNTVQNAIIGEDNSLAGGIVGASTLLLTNHLVVRFLFSHRRMEKMFEGEPGVLIENGVVREEQLRKELLTVSLLENAAHRQGYTCLEEIDKAVLEPGGNIFFVAKKGVREAAGNRELFERIDRLSEAVARLQASVEGKKP